MQILIYISIAAMLFCLITCLVMLFRIIKLGAPKDLSRKAGNVTHGVMYANIGAMSPMQKESAFMHLPTYAAGIVFHIGTFISLVTYLLLLIKPMWDFFFSQIWLSSAYALFLFHSAGFGLSLLVKRYFSNKLRPISNIDDYFSNFLVSILQIFTGLMFVGFASHGSISGNLHGFIICGFYALATLLFLYLPFGKLKHVVYYFAARYHLGFFYGRRGTWPPKKNNTSMSEIKN